MKKVFRLNIMNFIFLCYLETLFQILIFDSFELTSIFGILIYVLFVSFIITSFQVLFCPKFLKIFNYIFYTLTSVLFSTYFICKKFLKVFFSISLLKISDQAMDFASTTISVIVQNIFYVILFFIPLILLIVFRKKILLECENKIISLLFISFAILSFSSYKIYINTSKDKNLSMYDLYYNIDNNELAVQKLGVFSSFGLDVYRNIFGFSEKVVEVDYLKGENNQTTDYGYNVLDLNFDEKIDSTVKLYIEQNPGTKQNEYTGYFAGKNLIYIVAESFSEIAISESLTPTLYKLTNTGFVFDNFYVPYYLSTIGGEFQNLTGLYPNSSILSTWRSGKNDFPYGLANVFKNINYNIYAYHDHSGYFQDRYKYLKSLGFDNFKACRMGLSINCNAWPESDVEMIESTYIDYIYSETPFLTYYMTVSGHMGYTYSGNYIVRKNWDMVKDLDYSNEVKSYIATQIELDKALELLIKKLEETNKLEETVIVLVADHNPYALSDSQVNEISTYYRDSNFELYHNSLIIWNSELDTVHVDKVGMNIDVLPTVYNLFGIKYDSRLFAGIDLLSPTDGIVILNNNSWITNYGKYNSITGKFDGDKDDAYINNINNLIKQKKNFSKLVLSTNAYSNITEK